MSQLGGGPQSLSVLLVWQCGRAGSHWFMYMLNDADQLSTAVANTEAEGDTCMHSLTL